MRKKIKKIVLLMAIVLSACILNIHANAATKILAPKVSVSNVSSTGKIKLTWEKVDGAAKYNVYRSKSKTGNYSLLKTLTSTSLTNTSVNVGDTYYYYVRAVDKSGKSSNSSNVVSCTCDLARPTLTLSNVSSTGKIIISWNAVSGAEKYQLYYATSKAGTYTLLKTTTSTSIKHTSAVAGKTYYYKVRAIESNSAANSAYSEVKSRTCDFARPTLTLSNISSTGKIKISWNAVSGAQKYQLYCATSKTGTYTLLKTTTSTSIKHTSAVAGKTYYYKVRAIGTNSAANSAYSEIKSRTCDCAKPVVTLALNENGKPIITWDAVVGAVGYEVYRAIDPNDKFILLNTKTSTRMENTSAGAGVTYYYKVRAIAANSSGNSVYSTLKSITTSTPVNEILVTSYVLTPNVYIYPIPSDSAEATILPYMTQVKVGEAVSTVNSGCWKRVFYNGELFYTWIPTDTVKFTNTKSDFNYSGNTECQEAIIDLALKIYKEWNVFYTNDQSNGVMNSDGTYGFDCSGYVSYVLNTVIQKIVPTYRITKNITDLYKTDVLYNVGLDSEYSAENVELEEIQPGDILFFNVNGSKVDHCGIYLGNNEFIHCTEFWNGVCIMPLSHSFSEDLVAVRRFFPETFVAANLKMRINYDYVYLYAERDTSSEKLYQFKADDIALLLYKSSNGDWGYVRNADGKEGFVLMKRFDLVEE